MHRRMRRRRTAPPRRRLAQSKVKKLVKERKALEAEEARASQRRDMRKKVLQRTSQRWQHLLAARVRPDPSALVRACARTAERGRREHEAEAGVASRQGREPWPWRRQRNHMERCNTGGGRGGRGGNLVTCVSRACVLCEHGV